MKRETGLILHVALGVVDTYPGIFESATFSSRIQKFLAYTWRIQIEFACPHASDGIRIHCKESRPARCAAILVYCSVRDWTRFCYVIGFENIRIHPSTRYRIRCRVIFLRKEKVANSNLLLDEQISWQK